MIKKVINYKIKIFDTKRGFTLVEVLITLAVIGVISAIVIPQLIVKLQDVQYKRQYKKAFSVASQITSYALQNDLFIPRTGLGDQNASCYNFNVFRDQLSVAKLCYNNNNSQCWNPSGEKACDAPCGPGQPKDPELAFIDSSGMAWSMYALNEQLILVDTNGYKGPNRYGKDRWILEFDDKYNNKVDTGLPVKINPLNMYDILWFDRLSCHYYPCYYMSWLLQ